MMDLRSRRPRTSMDVDDEPIRVRQQKRRILRDIVHIQHHARHVVGILRRADALQKSIIGNREGLARQFLRQPRAMQVEVNAVGAGHARRLILHLVAKVDGDTRVRRA